MLNVTYLTNHKIFFTICGMITKFSNKNGGQSGKPGLLLLNPALRRLRFVVILDASALISVVICRVDDLMWLWTILDTHLLPGPDN